VSGWFWKYHTAVGTIYYVDCCGKKIQSDVWCNWSNEVNWCMIGRAAAQNRTTYGCTLAIPETLMTTAEEGGTWVVVGVDP
jgi:hypothetical protein